MVRVMQIPEFWAEHRLVGEVGGRRRVVRRFGWSDDSAELAEANARERAEQAYATLRAGDEVAWRERKLSYGDEGLPIREQVVRRDGTEVITRNSYGARCLNEPDVLFADLDLDYVPGLVFQGWAYFESVLLGIALWVLFDQFCLRVFLAVLLPLWLAVWRIQNREQRNRRRRGRFLARMRRGIERFVRRDPDARFAVYETPAGMRLLRLDRTFDPTSRDVATLFRQLGADPDYARLCAVQACFRARVSAKPWRIDMERPPTRAVWPVPEQRMAEREAWIRNYEERASAFAACRFLGEIGDGLVHPRCLHVQRVHDELSRAHSDLPIA